ncbi:unnamed protein product, partial [Mesorhabditis belari]|uniref:receptor protein-tyrosine kinase n=1 Tax=Mesorhabditis belari TaxID=2138241 RepID=A0AAF3FIU5_9BILA
MFIITHAILLFSLISTKGSTWIDTAEGHIIEEDFNGSYIEKEVGQNVTLLCHGNASLLWDFDRDKNQLQQRIKVNDSVTTLSLFIRDLNVVDTGKYSCQESNMSMTRSHIHMFVRGKSAFVERPNTDPIKLLKNNLRIPCRASRWIKGLGSFCREARGKVPLKQDVNTKMSKSTFKFSELRALHEQLMDGAKAAERIDEEETNVPLDQRIDRIAYDFSLEIDVMNLKIGPLLGRGEFGKVSKGYLKRATPGRPNEFKDLVVAVKDDLINDNRLQADFLYSNAKVLIATTDLLDFSWQIATGMEYLNKIPCFHRDLSARNVLITKNNLCRIADFGLAKSNEKSYYRKDDQANELLPLKWMSPETILNGYYSQASDIWSYGILLYEIFSLGAHPYPGMENRDVLDRVLRGERNRRPKYAPDFIYELLMKCWQLDPDQRPSFTDCVAQLKAYLHSVAPESLAKSEIDLALERKRLEKCTEWRAKEKEEKGFEKLTRWELCRSGYRFMILHGAFAIHPGIRPGDDSFRKKMRRKMWKV